MKLEQNRGKGVFTLDTGLKATLFLVGLSFEYTI